MPYSNHFRLFLLTGCAALVSVSCAPEVDEQTLKRRASERRSELLYESKKRPGHEKVWSGISYADEIYVQHAPLASFAAGGFDEERVWSVFDDWEPAIAADPGAPYVYQMTTRYGPSPAEIIFRRSVDGGATWEEPDQVFEPDSGDPLVEVSDDGTVYTLGIVGTPQWDLLLKRSFDHGLTWDDPPIDVIGPGPLNQTWGDRPTLVVSPDGQDVYVSYNRGDIYVVASHDGGATFNAEVQVTSNGRQWFTSAGAVAPNGDVYFVAADYTSNYTGLTYINVLRSTDGGANWTVTLPPLDSSTEAPECPTEDICYFNFLGPEIGLAIDVNGLVMITYNAGDVHGQAHKLWARTSSDGVVWSGRTEISSGIVGVNNAFPAMVASRTVAGDFRVVWQDDRAGNMIAWNTWMVNTLNGGSTWSESELLSDRTSPPPPLPPYKGPLGYSFPYGDYYEIAVDGNDVNHIIWGAGTGWVGPGGSWYTRGTPIPEPAVAYQLLAGAMLLSVLARRRASR